MLRSNGQQSRQSDAKQGTGQLCDRRYVHGCAAGRMAGGQWAPATAACRSSPAPPHRPSLQLPRRRPPVGINNHRLAARLHHQRGVVKRSEVVGDHLQRRGWGKRATGKRQVGSLKGSTIGCCGGGTREQQQQRWQKYTHSGGSAASARGHATHPTAAQPRPTCVATTCTPPPAAAAASASGRQWYFVKHCDALTCRAAGRAQPGRLCQQRCKAYGAAGTLRTPSALQPAGCTLRQRRPAQAPSPAPQRPAPPSAAGRRARR